MSTHPIFTIGYGTRPLSEFIHTLQRLDIAFLIDVRSQPYSRYKPEYSKQALASALKAAGIQYVFMGHNLGGRPSDAASYSNGKVDYAKLAARPFYLEGIARLQKAQQQGQVVAIMCAEGKPEHCHRTHLIAATLLALSIPVSHIDENGDLQSQADVLNLPLASVADSCLHASWDEWGGLDTAVVPPPVDDWLDAPLETDYLTLLPTISLPDIPRDMTLAQELLKSIFGYDLFRPLQADIINSLLAGHDGLVIMPTGSGKSLCYQLPALMFAGLTVVVSPLISLMEDQVSQLRELGIPAAYLNSTLPLTLYQETMSWVRNGRLKLLYAAPETLTKPDILALLNQSEVACLTIDEAHCISQWGHDFRPEYRQLAAVRQHLPDAVCLALTATATMRVRQDILTSLQIPEANEFVASFDRDNLFLAVQPKVDVLGQTLSFLVDHRDESGIIYCATRKQVEMVTSLLQTRGWEARPYHAGLDDATRQQNQHAFIRDDVPIMVATVAFGMGINKPNVRFILHVDLPKDLESYYQQIGRAGRDGLRADCLLLFGRADISTIQYFIQEMAAAEQKGAQLRLEAMVQFAESGLCRRRPLLHYFNETYQTDSCDMCDNCLAEDRDLIDITVAAQKFLSCIVRSGQIFGMIYIIDILRGSQRQEILHRRHDQLTTYGIGQELSKKQWRHLGAQLIQQGFIHQDLQHGSLKLTESAWPVLRNQETVMGEVEPETERHVHHTTTDLPYDSVLFAQLRQKRKALADEANVPPYVIFNDRSLAEMATYLPQSPASFAHIHGVGRMKLEKYAGIFLPIIQAYCQANDLTEKPIASTAPAPVRSSPVIGTRTAVIGDRYAGGQSIAEIAAEFEIKTSTVLNHLLKVVQGGRPLPADGFRQLSALSAAEQEQVLAAFTEHGPELLRPVYDALDETINYDELRLMRLVYLCLEE